jgi:hypothetical protein
MYGHKDTVFGYRKPHLVYEVPFHNAEVGKKDYEDGFYSDSINSERRAARESLPYFVIVTAV